MFDNPFTKLGIPKQLVIQCLDNEDSDKLVSLVDGIYKAITKLYHPDVGGESDLFAELTLARDKILDNPLAVARFFTSRTDRDMLETSKIFQDRKELKEAEISALLRLLENVDTYSVAPWMKRREALVGNLAFGLTKKSLLLIVSGSSKHLEIKLAPSNYDGRRFIFSRKERRWKATTSELVETRSGATKHKPGPEERVRPFARTDAVLVGGITEDDVTDILRSSDDDAVFDKPVIEASKIPAQLSWTPISQCNWITKIKPIAGNSQNDYLVIMSADNDNLDPRLSIIGPVFRTRSVS